MKNTKKCSAMLAAGMGAAVCITGGGDASAAVVTGLVAASNGDNTFNANDSQKCFGSLASWDWSTHKLWMSWGTNGTRPDRGSVGSYIKMHNAGETIGTANVWGASTMPPNVNDKYMGIRFSSGGTKYGWVHIVSSNGDSTSAVMDKWGYENTGASIKTLGESVSAQKLGLADGTTKLLWSNANEDGVSRYEAQTKDASGAWTAVSSDAAGAGHYSATVPAGATCRIVVEKVDGATEEITF